MKERSLQAIALLAGCLLLAVAASWPLAPHISEVTTSGRADGDLGYTLFAQWWSWQALTGAGSFFDCPLVYFPAGQNLAGSVWNLVVLFATAPFHGFADPITAYNLSILALATANAAAFFFLGQRLGGTPAGVLAAVVVSGLPYSWFELYEGRPEQGFLAPAALYGLALIRLQEGRPRAILMVGLSMAWVASCYWFMAPLLAVGLLPVLGRSLTTRDTWISLGKATGVCLAACAPFLALILPSILGTGGTRSLVDSGNASFMRMSNRVNPLEILVPFGEVGFLQHSIPIAATVGLLLAARHPAARVWVAAVALSILLATGIPMAALDLLPGFDRFWWPYRALGVVTVALAGALATWLGSLPRRQQLAGVLVLGLPLLLHGRFLTLSAVQHGDPNLPTSPLDPTAQGFWFDRNLPDWVQEPQEAGAVLVFPFPSVQNHAHRFRPFHGLPTAMGDGVGEPLIRPQSFNARISENRFLAAWAKGQEPPLDEAALEQVRTMGFRWILWVLPNPATHPEESARWRGEAHRLEPLLGQPEVQENTLLVWDLNER
jgi:hypothetical protein